MSSSLQNGLAWFRWIALVPVFLVVFKLGPWIAYESVLPWRGDPIDKARAFLIISGLATSFLQPLFCTAIAPAGRLLVAGVTAFLAALPGLCSLALGPFIKAQLESINGMSAASGADFVAIRHLAFAYLAGAILALLLLGLVGRWRRMAGATS